MHLSDDLLAVDPLQYTTDVHRTVGSRRNSRRSWVFDAPLSIGLTNISKRRFRHLDGALTPSLTLMTTFGLVHGSWHRAWCWERLAPLLQQAGHDVVAMDLPCDDGSASFDTYADVVCDALKGCNGDVVLVGHSLAGNTIPLVAARRPVRHLVYLCALIPDI